MSGRLGLNDEPSEVDKHSENHPYCGNQHNLHDNLNDCLHQQDVQDRLNDRRAE